MGATFADDGHGHPLDRRAYLPSWGYSSAESALPYRMMSGSMTGIRRVIWHDGFGLLARQVCVRARRLQSSHGTGGRTSEKGTRTSLMGTRIRWMHARTSRTCTASPCVDRTQPRED